MYGQLETGFTCARHGPVAPLYPVKATANSNFAGQIELYTHIPVMKQVVDQLQKWNFRLCAVFLLDSQFLIETSKFFAGAMTALSAMVTLELPHVNVLSKMDLLDKRTKKEVQKYVCLSCMVNCNQKHLQAKFW